MPEGSWAAIDGVMARCIPDFIEDMDDGHPERVFFDRLKAELPDEFVIIPSLEVMPERVRLLPSGLTPSAILLQMGSGRHS